MNAAPQNASTQRRMVIGIGNPARGDDGAGPASIAALRGRLSADIELLQIDGEAAALLALLEQASDVYLVDACHSGAPAGTVRRFDLATVPLPHVNGASSTHGLGLAEGVELARALDSLPHRCVLYAIEGHSYVAGEPLSPAVRSAVAVVAERIVREADGAGL